MTVQSFLAKNGLRSGILGSAAALVIAAPLAAGNLAPADTDGSRIGWYFDRTGADEGIGAVVMGTDVGRWSVQGLRVNAGGLRLAERAAVPAAPGAGNGSIWLRNDAPNVLMFTDDTGADWVIGGAGAGILTLNATGTDNVGTPSIGSYGAIGAGASDNVAIGRNALAALTTGTHNIAIGNGALSALTTGTHNTVVGNAATAANNNAVAIGHGSSVLQSSIAIGDSALANFIASISIGRNATATTNNQLVIGSTAGTISDAFIGRGVVAPNPQPVSINATGGSGSNIVGSTLTISGGRGTGSAVGGSLVFQTSPVGGAGSTLNAAVTRLTIDSVGVGLWGTGIAFTERAAVPAGVTAGRGHLWVRSDTPNVLVFTDDAGTDTVLGASLVTLNAVGTDNIGTPSLGTFAAIGAAATYNLGIGRDALAALTTGSNNIALGRLALTAVNSGGTNVGIGTRAGDTIGTGLNNTLVGDSADVTAQGVQNGTAIGAAALTGQWAVALGVDAQANTNNATALGKSARANFIAAIALGQGATTTAANQMVIGSDNAEITDAFIGRGITSATPSAVTLNVTGGSGTDIAGAALTIAGGRGTGSAVGGNIIFQTSPAGVAGTTLNALATVAQITNTSFDQVKGWIQSGKVTVTGAGGAPDATATGIVPVYLLDGGAATCTLNLDAAPVNGQRYDIKSIDSTNTVTIGRNGNNIDGAAADLTLATNDSYTLIYDTTFGWAIL